MTLPRWPWLQPGTIRSRIYITLLAIILLTLVIVTLIYNVLLGGYQDRVDRSRVRELATAWGAELFSAEGDDQTLERLLFNFETVPLLTGSIVDELDVTVMGLSSAGRVVRAFEAENRFLGETLEMDFAALNRARSVEGQVTARDGERLSYILASLPPEEQEHQDYCCVAVALVGEPRSALLAELTPRLLLAALVALVVASLVGFLLSRSIYRPIQAVAIAAQRVARGRLEERVAIGGSTEAQDLARSFNQMTAEVERQQTALRDFLANVSHDLQTPLTSINGFSQALLDGIVPDAEEPNAYRIIEDESRRLLRLVEGLLDLSRIEAGQVDVELAPVEVDALLSQVGELFALRAQELTVHLNVTESNAGEVLADWDRLDQVLGNLVDNALRHTPHQGTVSLTARREQRDAISIAVSDTGVGIPEEEIPNLFDRYYRSDRPGAQGGTGLGLAIARELVRAQGGAIEVSSQPQVGTTFRIVLPAANHNSTAVAMPSGTSDA